VGLAARDLQSNMRGCLNRASNRVPFGSRQQLFRARQSAGFGVLPGVGDNSRQRRAGRYIIGFGMPLLAELIGGQIHLPTVDIHFAFAEIFRFHACPTDFAAPFSTGAPTRLPHSVQEPS